MATDLQHKQASLLPCAVHTARVEVCYLVKRRQSSCRFFSCCPRLTVARSQGVALETLRGREDSHVLLLVVLAGLVTGLVLRSTLLRSSLTRASVKT
jgi:hypothetical protein